MDTNVKELNLDELEQVIGGRRYKKKEGILCMITGGILGGVCGGILGGATGAAIGGVLGAASGACMGFVK